MKKKDWKEYIGKTYNENVLIVDTFSKNNGRRNIQYFKCKCKRCGEYFNSSTYDVLRNDNKSVKSCGCLQKEKVSKIGKATGKTNIMFTFGKHKRKWDTPTQINGVINPIYINYRNMISRCYNDKDICYSSYGGKGIDVFEDWMDFDKYANWAYLNGYKDHYQAHRLDNEVGYFPENVVFLSKESHAYITKYMRDRKITYLSKEDILNILKDN